MTFLPQNPTRSVESPCIRLCAIDQASGLCEGCGRTLDEVVSWLRLTPEARRAVMELLPARLDTLRASR